MKLHILSDLHTEFGDFKPPDTDADVVVLAGDIGVGIEGLRWAERRFPNLPVIYVPGNHEFYHHDITLIDELKQMAPDHIHVLDNDSMVVDDVRFLGCVLWTDFELFGITEQYFAVNKARQAMNDFSVIKCNAQRFTPHISMAIHSTSRQWLANQLALPFDGKTVVVTHHLPSPRSVSQRYATDPLSAAFASNLESMMGEERVAMWIHGHTHDAFDYEIEGTRVICNPRGYAPHDLTVDFRPNLLVAV